MTVSQDEAQHDPVIFRRLLESLIEDLDMTRAEGVKTALERVKGAPLADLYLSSSLCGEGHPHEVWIARTEIERQAQQRLRVHETRMIFVALLGALIGGLVGGGLHIFWL